MAGRGRGRGRGMSFNIETLGFAKGEALPGPILQPPPTFPMLEFKAVPLQTGEEYDYLLALKQEFRSTMRESPYYMQAPEKKKDIARYSDKYQLGQQNSSNWAPDWSRVPTELKVKSRRKAKVKVIAKPKVIIRVTKKAGEEINKQLEELEKKEAVDDGDEEETKDEAKDGEEAEDDAEYYDEEEMEEETDYNMTYFDNGEEAFDDDEDVDEGPTY